MRWPAAPFVPAQRVADGVRVRRTPEKEAGGVRQQRGVGAECQAGLEHELQSTKFGNHLKWKVVLCKIKSETRWRHESSSTE